MKKMITIEEFARNIGISRSTAYSWISAGKLVKGKHLVRIGRVVRIIWDDVLLAHLLAISDAEAEADVRPKLERNGKGGRNKTALDMEYLENLP
jgi:excisionase family DNA binding protein